MLQLTNYIAFQVEKYDEAIKFYTDILQWELVKYTPEESKFKVGDTYFFIEKKEEKPLNTFFELVADDISLELTKLIDNGCEITQQFSEKSMMLKDRFGFRFHLYEKGAVLPDL